MNTVSETEEWSCLYSYFDSYNQSMNQKFIEEEKKEKFYNPTFAHHIKLVVKMKQDMKEKTIPLYEKLFVYEKEIYTNLRNNFNKLFYNEDQPIPHLPLFFEATKKRVKELIVISDMFAENFPPYKMKALETRKLFQHYFRKCVQYEMKIVEILNNKVCQELSLHIFDYL
jgi:hypothetical protein